MSVLHLKIKLWYIIPRWYTTRQQDDGLKCRIPSKTEQHSEEKQGSVESDHRSDEFIYGAIRWLQNGLNKILRFSQSAGLLSS